MALWRIVDANLLFDAVLHAYAKTAAPALKKKALNELGPLKHDLALSQFYRACGEGRVTTTALVMTEVGTLVKRKLWPQDTAKYQSPTWGFLAALHQVMQKIGLHVYNGRDLQPDASVTRKFGPADSGLIAVTRALNQAEEEGVLYTSDDPLAEWCKVNEVRCERFSTRFVP